MEHRLLAIVGPTASGKTELGLRLARQQNGEIISVDSRQVYRYLSIGTAKPTGKWTLISQSPRQVVSRGLSMDPPLTTAGDDDRRGHYLVDGIPYHLVDFLEPSESFSAADFVRLAIAKVVEIRARGKTPIFVGGTGLYFKALTQGLAPLPPANPAVRDLLKKEALEKGREALHKRLARLDPEAAANIPANNIQRLVRALEVYELTGKPISQWHREHSGLSSPRRRGSIMSLTSTIDSRPPHYWAGAPKVWRARFRGNDNQQCNLRFIGIGIPREELHRRIEARCRRMMAEGMIEETRSLLEQGFAEDCTALSGLGYPRIIAMLKATLSKEECLKLLIQDTRQYAKRQMTWFRHQLPVSWNK